MLDVIAGKTLVGKLPWRGARGSPRAVPGWQGDRAAALSWRDTLRADLAQPVGAAVLIDGEMINISQGQPTSRKQ